MISIWLTVKPDIDQSVGTCVMISQWASFTLLKELRGLAEIGREAGQATSDTHGVDSGTSLPNLQPVLIGRKYAREHFNNDVARIRIITI